MKFKKATKFQSFLKLGLSGPPGAGKTYTALAIASLLSQKRVAVIDAESGSAGKYANLFDFDMNDIAVEEKEDGTVVDVPDPYSPKRYMEAMRTALELGEYDVLIIDGISPEWDDAGGCLQAVDKLKKRFASEGEKAATRNAWALVTPHHKDFINLILRLKMHVICTMQARKEEVIVKDDNGKIVERKKTLEPIQRDGIERVFDIFAKMEERDMIIDKTRCPELDGQVFHKPGKEVADIISEWLKGEPLPERPEYEPEIMPAGLKVSSPAKEAGADAPITEQQIASLRKLCQFLGRSEPEEIETIGYLQAKELIVQLSHEYNQQKQATRPKSA